MRLNWIDQVPQGISVQDEEHILTEIEGLAQAAGYEVVSPASLEYELRSRADLVLDTPKGLLLFEVRRKSNNGRARIDIETRPNDTYRTRHLLLQQTEGEPWELINDSDLREGDVPRSADELRKLVDKLFAGR